MDVIFNFITMQFVGILKMYWLHFEKTLIVSPCLVTHSSLFTSLQKNFVECFDDGDHKVFFELWTDSVTSEVVDADAETLSLEFDLHIYFTIYPWMRHLATYV